MLAAALALCACDTVSDTGPYDGGFTPIAFDIGAVHFVVRSGASITVGGQLNLLLSDQSDACGAYHMNPLDTSTLLDLRVSAATDGTTRATVIAGNSSPAAGQAAGTLKQYVGQTMTTTASYNTSDGTVSWTVLTDGSGTVILNSVDLGFAGETGRLATSTSLNLTLCQ